MFDLKAHFLTLAEYQFQKVERFEQAQQAEIKAKKEKNENYEIDIPEGQGEAISKMPKVLEKMAEESDSDLKVW